MTAAVSGIGSIKWWKGYVRDMTESKCVEEFMRLYQEIAAQY